MWHKQVFVLEKWKMKKFAQSILSAPLWGNWRTVGGGEWNSASVCGLALEVSESKTITKTAADFGDRWEDKRDARIHIWTGGKTIMKPAVRAQTQQRDLTNKRRRFLTTRTACPGSRWNNTCRIRWHFLTAAHFHDNKSSRTPVGRQTGDGYALKKKQLNKNVLYWTPWFKCLYLFPSTSSAHEGNQPPSGGAFNTAMFPLGDNNSGTESFISRCGQEPSGSETVLVPTENITHFRAQPDTSKWETYAILHWFVMYAAASNQDEIQ